MLALPIRAAVLPVNVAPDEDGLSNPLWVQPVAMIGVDDAHKAGLEIAEEYGTRRRERERQETMESRTTEDANSG